MAISTKGKRKISVNGQSYLWKAFDEYDQSWFDGIQVMIVAQDQSVAFRYGALQRDDNRHVIMFPKNEDRIMYSCPKFEDEKLVFKPEQIRNIIEFCIEQYQNKHNKLLNQIGAKDAPPG